MRSLIKSGVCVIALSACLAGSNARAAIELVSNGNFNSALTGWTVTSEAGSSGTWFVDTVGTTTPYSAHTTSAANLLGAAASGLYAVSDQGSSSVHAMEQSFFVPGAASSVILSFDMFVNDSDGGPIVNPAGLTKNSGANQHARVDLLSAGSSPLVTGGSVLANLYLGVDPQATNPNAFKHYSIDITALVGAGGIFDLRFAEVDTQSFLNMGVDNVSVMFTARETGGVVPEPISVIVWGTIAGACVCTKCGSRRRRDKRAGTAIQYAGLVEN
jgi:hypothetical protein